MADRPKHLDQRVRQPSTRRAATGHMPTVPLPPDLPNEPIAIADMANIFGVTHRTLHFYEEKSLIAASRIGLMRVYMHSDVERMALINACREVGMPVAVIQELMEELNETPSRAEADIIFRHALEVRKRELTANLSTIRRQMQQITMLLPETEDGADEHGRESEEAIQLSDIERRCLTLMAEGYAPTRLARVLDMKSDEIAFLEHGIIQKFSARNRFQAIAKAVLLGIVHA